MPLQEAQVDHAIVDILVVKDNKFLLVEEGKPSRKGLLNLPGGHVEADETLFDAALREVKGNPHNRTSGGSLGDKRRVIRTG